jgi:FkbM family methyltransferase
MKSIIKAVIKDRKIEPYVRWCVKRVRGIHMPFDLVKNEIYDRQAVNVMGRVLNDSSNCIDIGCHQGQFLKEFLKSSPNGKHYAFEPIPELAERLSSDFPSVQVYPYALSSEAGESIFYIVPDSLALSGLDRREFISPEKSRQAIKVKIEKLDKIIPVDMKIDLIKIDVEGAEGPVISGAIETIKRNKPYLIIEHGASSSEAFGFSSRDLYDLIVDKCGLNIALLSNWLNSGAALTVDEFMLTNEWYFIAYPE